MSKTPKRKGCEPASGRGRDKSPKEIEIKRHYQTLSPKETDELVDAFAELAVERVKTKGVPGVKKQETGPQAHEPDEPANEPG
jgi:hypothetical protein